MKSALLSTALLFVALFFFHQIHAQDIRVPYRVDDQWGFADLKGVIKIQPAYDSVAIPGNTNDYSLMVFKNNASWKAGIIDYQGKVLVDTRYDRIEYHRNPLLCYTTTSYVKDQTGRITDSLQSLIGKEGKVLIGEGPYTLSYPAYDIYQVVYHGKNKGSKFVIFKQNTNQLQQELVFNGPGLAYINDADEIVWHKADGETTYYTKNSSGKFIASKTSKQTEDAEIAITEEVVYMENSRVDSPYKATVMFENPNVKIEVSLKSTTDKKQTIAEFFLKPLTKSVKLNPAIVSFQPVSENGRINNRATTFTEWYYEYLPDEKKFIILFPWERRTRLIEADAISENILYTSEEVIVKIKKGDKWFAHSTKKGLINPLGHDDVLFHATEQTPGGINNREYILFAVKENSKYSLMDKYGKIRSSKGYDRIEYVNGYNRFIESDRVNFYILWKEYFSQLPLEYYSHNEPVMLYGQGEFYVFMWAFKKEGDKVLRGLVSPEGVGFFKE